ncbi:acetyl-CoA carboxylase biotin carboxylase subunit [Cumulibacter soli]|uniref:acetyl-CoA carboxylase biotin carboxylase subunit n=1 Tax=Cumulibacter soli TaxID=2546344 RepID=UPI001FBB2D8A|nr:biotin carboxylase N-terminal domain-containing protein [Cumulibacter soli]
MDELTKGRRTAELAKTNPELGKPFERILVANRGAIARRIMRSAKAIGVSTVAVYSDVDEGLPHMEEADKAVNLSGSAASETYLNVAAILEAARVCGADAVHPGYGFLSEDPDFAQAVTDAGLTWVGPRAESIRLLGDKVSARNHMASVGLAVAAGSTTVLDSLDASITAAREVGYPVIVKAVAGGGGIGMAVASDEVELRAAYESASAAAARFFGDERVMVERFVTRARHIEVQILGWGDGEVVTLGERDCSVQRRNQKIVEETPAPRLAASTRESMQSLAAAAVRAANYANAGTIEFLLDNDTGEFSFLEMNTRLQVEHGITEMVTGVDLVEQQMRIAAGQSLSFDPKSVINEGHAIELRLYAEDPIRFIPSPGRITQWKEPVGDGIRVESGYRAGSVVSHFYDPMLAKLIVWGESRGDCLRRARAACDSFRVEGIRTNLPLLAALLEHDDFCAGNYETSVVDKIARSSIATS